MKLPLLAAVLLLSTLSIGQTWVQNYTSQPIDSLSETVTWTSVVPASTQVRYGTTTSTSSTTTRNNTLTTGHSVTLTNLLDGVTYYWRPVSRDSSSVSVTGVEASFQTKVIVVTVSPNPVTLVSGGTQQFTATVAGSRWR